MGKAEEVSRGAIRRAASIAAKRMRALGVTQGAFHLPAESRGEVGATDAGQAVAEGLAQGAWQFLEMKRPGEDRKPPLERVNVLSDDDAFADGHRSRRRDRRRPDLRPRDPGAARQRLHADLPGGAPQRSWPPRHGHAVTVLDKAAIVREKMGALLAVAQGSEEEPRFIALEYKGADGAPIVLVGKGVTFDTGGISIKPAQNMEDMKYDMSGAAAVLGTFEMLGRLKPPVHVIGLDSQHGEHAVRHRGEAGRRDHEPPGQDDRGDQHRCRGPPDPLRRALLCPALSPGLRDRHRHAHWCHRGRARTHGRGRHGHRRCRWSRRSAGPANGPANGCGRSRSGTSIAT